MKNKRTNNILYSFENKYKKQCFIFLWEKDGVRAAPWSDGLRWDRGGGLASHAKSTNKTVTRNFKFPAARHRRCAHVRKSHGIKRKHYSPYWENWQKCNWLAPNTILWFKIVYSEKVNLSIWNTETSTFFMSKKSIGSKQILLFLYNRHLPSGEGKNLVTLRNKNS